VSIGDKVRAIRKAVGISQEEVARRAGVSLNVINRLERDVILDPHYSTLRGIASALGVPVADLVREPVLLGKAEAPGTGRPADEYEEVLIPRTSLSDTDVSQSALKFLFDYVGTYQDRVEDLSGRIEDGYIEVGLKMQGSGPQVIQVARGDEPEEVPPPELKHDIDAAFDRIVATLRDAGVEEEFIDEYDGPVRRRALAEVARA
jgi:transcriptional regulator with XRE-family HTH domain